VSARTRHRIAVATLIAITLIWGSTFVMVKEALDAVGPLTFVALRFWLAAAVLAVAFAPRLAALSRAELRAGALTGLALGAGYIFQTVGLQFTSSSKAGFITGLNVVIVPLVAAPLLGEKPRPAAAAGTLVAAVGLALLSLDARLRVQPGDLWILACAFAFAFHIVGNGAYATRHDPLRLALVQLGTVALIATGAALTLERPSLALPADTWFAIVFTGLVATALVFSLQLVAQQNVSAAQTALIFVLEPVFAALFGWLLAGEVLTGAQWAGSLLILAGMVASEVRGRGE
jgi:drug/metabolite transporter (DMT)-like permease